MTGPGLKMSDQDAASPEGYGPGSLRALFWVWLSGVLVFGALCLAGPLQSGGIVLAAIVLHAIVSAVILLSLLPRPAALLVSGGMLARVGAMFIDLYAPFDLPFMGDGGDSEGFLRSALYVAENLDLAGDTYGGIYTGLIGILFWLIGPHAAAGQYLNVVLGLSSVLLLVYALSHISCPQRTRLLIIAVAAFMPTGVIYSAVLLRESIVQFLVTASFVVYVRSVILGRSSLFALSVILVMTASLFHAGVVGVLVGYAVITPFVQGSGNAIRFGLRNVGLVIPILIGVAVLLMRSPDLFLAKFATIESEVDLLADANRRAGESAYLTSLQVDSWPSFMLYAPVRAFYFLGAPLPWDWRGFMDAVAFMFDSSIYVSVLLLVSKNRHLSPSRRVLGISLITIFCITTLIFGAGVSNAGTAMRHRSKLMMILLFMAALFARRATSLVDTPPHQVTPTGGSPLANMSGRLAALPRKAQGTPGRRTEEQGAGGRGIRQARLSPYNSPKKDDKT